MEDVDMILRIYHTAIQSGSLKVGQSAVLDKLLEKVSHCLSCSLSSFLNISEIVEQELINSTCLQEMFLPTRMPMAQLPSDPELKEPHKCPRYVWEEKAWIRVQDHFVFCRLYKFKCRMHTIDVKLELISAW